MASKVNKLIVVARREYLVRVRTKWFIFSTLLAPVLFSLFAFVPILMMKNDAKAVVQRLIVLDVTGASLGRSFSRALGAARTPDVDSLIVDVKEVAPPELEAARAQATSDVAHRLASGFIVLDSATMRGASLSYAGRHADSRGERTMIADAARSGLIARRLESSGVAATIADSAVLTPVPVVNTRTINDAGYDQSTPAKTLLAIFVAFFLYVSTIFYGQSMLSGVIEEKMSRVAEIVISSISPDTLLAGKVIGITLVGLTQQVIWVLLSVGLVSMKGIIFGAAATQAHAAAGGGDFGSAAIMSAIAATPISWVVILMFFFLLGFVFYGALFAAVGATVGSEQDARQAAQPVIMLLVLTAVFISPTASSPMSTSARVMSMLPFSSPIIMPLRMAVTTVPLTEQIGSLVILLASCAGAIWIAARIYRIGLLMYGKRPSLAELRRWIFSS